MSTNDERLIEMEIRYTHQEHLLEELNTELYNANERIDLLERKIERLTDTIRQHLDMQAPPANEKPPHY